MTSCVSLRLSVRAFTQLDEDQHGSPLYTDTFLSLPLVTEAGADAPHFAVEQEEIDGWRDDHAGIFTLDSSLQPFLH